MAPLEYIFPDEMHTPPTPVAYAAKCLCGHQVLTSASGMIWWRNGPVKAPNDLIDHVQPRRLCFEA